jgi:hypothetical protein
MESQNFTFKVETTLLCRVVVLVVVVVTIALESLSSSLEVIDRSGDG